jgi:hypothetical protein
MSALGQKQTCAREIAMSALRPKADIAGRQLDVRFVPEADSCTAAIDGRAGKHLLLCRLHLQIEARKTDISGTSVSFGYRKTTSIKQMKRPMW